MQQLQAKLKNVPVDASQVHCSTSSALNKEEIPSVQDKVLTCNNLDGNPLQHTGGRNHKVSAVVCVRSISGVPLMPTDERWARILLKSGRAKIVGHHPLVVQMLVPTGSNKQEIELGIDSGYKMVGFSCVSRVAELVSGELELDKKTKERLAERKMYRRGRRNKLWYRKPRWGNRTKSSDWLPPSVERSYNAHLILAKKLYGLLPISSISVEVGNFDTQKLINPDIEGTEYQQGNQYGFANVQAFVIAREKAHCQLCGKQKGNDVWRFHHIIGRKDGGTDRPDNICLLHAKCHEKLHKKHLEGKIKKSKEYKESTFMNIVKNRFAKDLGCETTYGYITFNIRKELGLEKSHVNDAFVIAGGTNQTRCQPIHLVQKHKNNRVIQLNRKGFAPSIRKQRYAYQPHDLVRVKGEIFEVVGVHCYGKQVIVKNSRTKLDVPVRNIQWAFHFNSMASK